MVNNLADLIVVDKDEWLTLQTQLYVLKMEVQRQGLLIHNLKAVFDEQHLLLTQLEATMARKDVG